MKTLRQDAQTTICCRSEGCEMQQLASSVKKSVTNCNIKSFSMCEIEP